MTDHDDATEARPHAEPKPPQENEAEPLQSDEQKQQSHQQEKSEEGAVKAEAAVEPQEEESLKPPSPQASSSTKETSEKQQTPQQQAASPKAAATDNEPASSPQSHAAARDKKRTSKSDTAPAYVDHTYHDFSQLEIQDSDQEDYSSITVPGSAASLPPRRVNLQSTQRKGIENFPAKLHKILSRGRYKRIVSWKEHGRSWTILDKERLSNVVCPENFSHSNFDSFNRSVNGWGFKVRTTQSNRVSHPETLSC